MEKVVLISGSFTSANVNVMLSIIRSMYSNPEIHIVARQYFKNELFPSENGVICHPVSSIRWDIIQKLKYTQRLKTLCYGVRAVFDRFFGIVDNYIPSSLERNTFKECCKFVNKEEFLWVFSVSDPFYTHRVAEKVSRKKSIKWCPVWLDSYSNGIGKQSIILEYSTLFYENRIFKKAPKIYSLKQSFVGNKLISKYDHKIKYFRIPYVKEIDVTCRNKDIIYAGLIGDANRNPYPILNMFIKALPFLKDNIQFHFYVRTPEDYLGYQEESGGRIKFHSFVSRDVLEKILSESYMLINIGNAISFQLPSKVVENISYRKPILCFYSQKNDPSFEYFNVYPDIFIQDTNAITQNNVDEFISFVNRNHEAISFSDIMKYPVFRECTPQAIREIFLSE